MFAVLSIRSPRMNCSCYSYFLDFDAHFSAVEYSVAYFHKGTFGIKKPSHFNGTGHHFESFEVVGHIFAFVPPPKDTYSVTLNG